MAILKLLYKYFKFWGGAYKCIICNTRVRKFFPFSNDIQKNARSQGFPYDFRRIETLNFEQYNCPFCMASDRERLYLIFLEKYFQDQSKKYFILDFAPSPAFSRKLRKISQINYVTADFFRNDVDLQVDICNMEKIGNDHFDFIICSHILEHVPYPDHALREILRIIRPGGLAIIMVPLFWDVLETVEDAAHTTDKLRLRYYGQEDHVRLFSRVDFLKRLNSAGFSVQELRPSDFDQRKLKENAIAENSVLYICGKPA